MAGCYSPATPSVWSSIVLSLLRSLPLAALNLALALPAAAQSTTEIGGVRFIGAVTVPKTRRSMARWSAACRASTTIPPRISGT